LPYLSNDTGKTSQVAGFINQKKNPLKIKTALVGYGLGGRCFHAPFIHASPHFELKAVLQRHGDQAAADYPGIRIYRDMETLLQDEELQLVVITTPNHTHFSLGMQVLQAGKMLVIDKPLTITSTEARSLIDRAASNNCLLSVYQSRRYASDARTIEKLVKEQKLGKIHEMEAHYDRYRPQARDSWKETSIPGSGILFDLGPHLIDQALYLFGLPEYIYADIRQQRAHAITDDYFDIRLYFPGGCCATLKAGMMVREPGPRYLLHGDKGSFIKWGDDPQDAALRAGLRPTDDSWGREPEDSYGLLHTEWQGKIIREKIPSEQGHFGLYYENLYQHIAAGAPLKEKPEHGYNAVRIIELARESSRKQCRIACSGLIEIEY
jgi:predicted dehydrogenase